MSGIVIKTQTIESVVSARNKQTTRKLSELQNDSSFVTSSGSVQSVQVANTAKTITGGSGVSANTYGPTGNVTINASASGSINIPYFTVNSQGIITSAVNRKLTITTGCSNCNNCTVTTSCTYCTDCSQCTDCSKCSHCSDCNCEP